MDYDYKYITLARAILALCRDYTEETEAPAGLDARAMTTALSVMITRAKDPAGLAAVIIRDLAEAAIRERVSLPPARRRRKNVFDLEAARKRVRPESE